MRGDCTGADPRGATPAGAILPSGHDVPRSCGNAAPTADGDPPPRAVGLRHGAPASPAPRGLEAVDPPGSDRGGPSGSPLACPGRGPEKRASAAVRDVAFHP